MALVGLTGFQNLCTNQLPHNRRGHLQKNTAEYLPDPNEPEFGRQQVGSKCHSNQYFNQCPSDSDSQPGLGTTALDSCFLMLLTTWKQKVMKVIQVSRGKCENSDYIFQS